jgi:hypothetical protein
LNVTVALVPPISGTLFLRVSRLWVTFSAVADHIEARSEKSWPCVMMIRSRKLGDETFEVKWLRYVGGTMEAPEQITVSIFSSKRWLLRS